MFRKLFSKENNTRHGNAYFGLKFTIVMPIMMYIAILFPDVKSRLQQILDWDILWLLLIILIMTIGIPYLANFITEEYRRKNKIVR